jgi:hypothetical protein
MPRKSLPGFAADTEVPVDRSKLQIEALLVKYGAEGYHTGWQAATSDDPGWDAIEFLWKGKTIRFRLPRPAAAGFTDKWGMPLSGHRLQAAIDQKNRQRWRVLFLVVKAKLEAVETGLAIFEEEFMSFIVTASGRTIGEILLPRIAAGGSALRLEEGRG